MLQTERIDSNAGRAYNVACCAFHIFKELAMQVKLWHLLSSVMAVLLGVGGLVWAQATQIAEQRKDIEYLKKDNTDFKIFIKDINNKLDVMSIKQEDRDKDSEKRLTEILITLQNKENRK